MNRISKLTVVIGAFAFFVTTLPHAFADYKPNRKDTDLSREQVEELGFTGILPLDRTGFTIFQRANTPANELVFKIISRIPLEGCFDSIPFEAEQKIEGKAITVDLKFPIIRSQGHPGCKKQRVMESTEIIIDLDELRENEINVMRLTSRYSTRSFDLELTDERISLEPRESVLLEGLEYWFLPDNAVTLKVPMAKEDLYYKHEMLQQLASLADNNGLVPIETEIPNFMPSELMYNTFFFIDKDRKVRESLNENGGFVTIGSIHKTEPFYGPNGKYDKKIPIDVIATLPEDIF